MDLQNATAHIALAVSTIAKTAISESLRGVTFSGPVQAK
jgi:hypothetical protein